MANNTIYFNQNDYSNSVLGDKRYHLKITHFSLKIENIFCFEKVILVK